MLDLGRVKEIAEISVNGKALGEILWEPPFQVDVRRAKGESSNELLL